MTAPAGTRHDGDVGITFADLLDDAGLGAAVARPADVPELPLGRRRNARRRAGRLRRHVRRRDVDEPQADRDPGVQPQSAAGAAALRGAAPSPQLRRDAVRVPGRVQHRVRHRRRWHRDGGGEAGRRVRQPRRHAVHDDGRSRGRGLHRDLARPDPRSSRRPGTTRAGSAADRGRASVPGTDARPLDRSV